jgi:hypothetical protein
LTPGKALGVPAKTRTSDKMTRAAHVSAMVAAHGYPPASGDRDTGDRPPRIDFGSTGGPTRIVPSTMKAQPAASWPLVGGGVLAQFKAALPLV